MGHGIDGQIKALSEVLPVFMDLGQGPTRFLYVHRFAEKSGINEAIIWEELRHHSNTSHLKSRFSETQNTRKYGSDLQFFNLLLHYPENIDTFKDKEWELIVSDPEIIAIIKVIMEKFPSEGNLDRIEEFLDSPVEKEQLRVSLMSQPFYSEESVSQAVSEFEKKIAKVKVSQSIRKASAEGDMEMVNRLIRKKQDLDSR
ncbi:MAG: hypothetical protein JRJ57_05185 [Deltaproteobacteria bacterium]|nr:hypothetical protein [Deltaproteobacteria bacterium]